MWQGFPIRPDQASTIAQGVDYLYYFLTAIDLFFTAVIFLTIFYFAMRYRRRSSRDQADADRGKPPAGSALDRDPAGNLRLVIFLWGTSLFIRNSRPPAASTEIFVVGKQWMWKLQHPEGVEEINELHVPVNRPIKLTMTSEDVIHDFSVPAFRDQEGRGAGNVHDACGFRPPKPGRSTSSATSIAAPTTSLMKGEVIVMEPTEYEQWLSGGIRGGSMAEAGAKLYDQLACITCHGTGKGPPFVKHLWQAGKTDRRHDGDGGRRLHAGIGPLSLGQNRGGLPAHHAHLQGPGDGGTDCCN